MAKNTTNITLPKPCEECGGTDGRTEGDEYCECDYCNTCGKIQEERWLERLPTKKQARTPNSRTGAWRHIENEREKYAAYLCSREWSLLKTSVHTRSGGTCERCGILPGNQVHHLTYIRKYDEDLGDLQHVCKFCHDFIHAFSDFDPASAKCWLDRLPLVKVFLAEPKYSEGLMRLIADGEKRGFHDATIRAVVEKYQDAAVQSIDF